MKRVCLPIVVLLVTAACSTSEAEPASQATASAGPSNPIAEYEPSEGHRAEVIEALQKLFDALETGDEGLLRSVVDPSVVMHFSESRAGETTFGSSTLDGLASRITSSDVPLIERMWDPVVVVNGALATIWTPYDFYAGTEFSHCGVDAANLMNTPEGWRIVALSWTRLQPPDCDLHPDGPPAG